ncbi:type IIL restriction-modification enzyme MmeI [Flavobacterium olei]|uniref:type IIL restriction-modification enzyme MmeI n=1 Tax=Flavobacterium olei TaxID=1886782 RepID=UPI00321AC932
MDPLFSENFLSNYIPNFKLSNVPNIRLARNIIDGLLREMHSGKIGNAKEEEFKSRFLNEFFGDILGFNYGTPNYWTLREEAKSRIDGTKPDGVLGFFSKDKTLNDVRAVIEIKDANTELDKKQNRTDAKSPAAQAFEYATKMGVNCSWVIVSNFREIRFYSSKFQGSYQVFFLEDLATESKLKEILYLFHKDRFIIKEGRSATDKLYDISLRKINENEKPRHILDEIHTSLIQFNGLQYIDPNYLVGIKPFNILNENVWHYRDNNLLSINPKIYELFTGLDFNEGAITISEVLKKDLEESRVIEYKDKIYEVVRILNHCQITKISCIEDYKKVIIARSNVIGFSHKQHFQFSDKEGFSKNIDILKYNPCDCLSCNFKTLDFKNLLSRLKAGKNKEEHVTLEYAYGNYLVSANNYKDAFNIYKALSERIKGKEGFEVQYFLAKLNMKYLLNLVWEDETLQDTFEIKQEIRNIDLNKILYEEIEYSISDEVRNYLHNIKDNKLFLSVKNEVEKLAENISVLKAYYDKGEHQSPFGSNHINELAYEYDRLQLHLNTNRIIYNVFSDYKLLTARVFTAFVDSYLTKGEGIASFKSYYLKEFLINVDIAQFKKILSKTDSVKINEKSEIEIVNSITNLLKSYFGIGMFANTPYKNSITKEYLIDFHFQERYLGLVSNAFTLLSKIDISEKNFSPLSQVLINYLLIEDELAWYHLEELGTFIRKKGGSFLPEQLIKILEIAVDRDKPNNNKYEGLLKDTSVALHKFFPDTKISNKRLINKVKGNIDGIHKWRTVSYLLNVTDDPCRQILHTEIEEMLDQKFHSQIYDHLIRMQLYDYKKKDYFKTYIEEIKLNREKGFNNEFIQGKPVFEGHTFHNFIILLNILEIDRKSELLEGFGHISEFEKWLLDPNEYDYRDFDAKWILAADNIYILKSLKGIKPLIKSVETELKQNYNGRISEIYYKNLL